jgi:uncharacterized protein YcfJ
MKRNTIAKGLAAGFLLAAGLAGCGSTNSRVAGDCTNLPGAAIGGVAGGVLGSQVGSGRGRDAAIGAGAATGAVIGSRVGDC